VPSRYRSLIVLLALFLLSATTSLADYGRAQRKQIDQLAPGFREWLLVVEHLISDDELETFLGLEKDYQRDAFIRRFWLERDPYPETARNEFKSRWEERVDFARTNFDNLEDDRARLLLLNGAPLRRLVVNCPTRFYPMEVWFYDGSDNVGFQFFLIFVRPGDVGPFRLWYPTDGLDRLFNTMFVDRTAQPDLSEIERFCEEGRFIVTAIAWTLNEGRTGFPLILMRIEERPEPPGGEWVATFNAYSTDLPEDAAPLSAELAVQYPGRQQSRTVTQGVLRVPRAEAGTSQLAEYRSYNFLLNGEVLREGELFEAFRYKFDLPSGEVEGDTLPMVFQRTLRPGEYTLIVKLEDLNSGKFFRTERALSVPELDKDMPPPPPADPETARLLREANAAISSGETTLQLIEPHGELHTGYMRLDTLTTGAEFDKVTFFVDGKPVLTKKRPPYSVDVDLGDLPRTRKLRAVGYDEAGEEIASDEILVNASRQRFAVRLVEPRKGRTYTESLLAEAEVSIPDNGTVERVEFYLNETLLATLFQPPYTQPVVVPPEGEIAYVRAVAYQPDGNSTEDLVFINAPEYLEEVDVQFVELFTTVLDRDKRPVDGLARENFQVFEDGVQQQILRFEQVKDLPFHAAIMLDVSASMDDSLDTVQQAALSFFQDTLTPKDRATLITFNDRPNLAVKFTNEVNSLAGGLAGLKAERGTALYDSLIFTLYYFNGIRGQKAALLLSDGKDEASRFSFEDTLEYARRAGVTLYAIGLKEAAKDGGAKRKLSQLAEETGGRAFFIREPSELAAIYQTIQEELRSQYLIAYQSSNSSGETNFREVELKVDRSGLEVKTLSGYYP
jgi:Ca-activated chloride channel family protein